MSARMTPVALASPARCVMLVLPPGEALLLSRAAAGEAMDVREAARLAELGKLLRDAALASVQS